MTEKGKRTDHKQNSEQFQVLYIPVGVGTFHLESAANAFEASKNLLKKITDHVIFPEEMLLTIASLKDFLKDRHPHLVIFQNLTFANAAYISEVLASFDCPILLWTLKEPVIDGGRLRLNSLTGAFSAANTIRMFRKNPFPYIYGGPDEPDVETQLRAVISAAKVKYQLTLTRIASVGHTPEGFGFGRALDGELLRIFGVRLESVEAREMIEKAKEYQKEEILPYLEDAESRIRNLDSVPKGNLEDFARLYKAYIEFARENNIAALSSRCWPDFFTSYGTPVCAVLAMLNDLGIAASCEADTYGALSMYIGMQFSGKPVYFGDPVSINEEENTITYWHCGTAACSLARKDTGACAGVHCNRKIGPTLEFGCHPWKQVTVFRVGRKADGSIRFYILEGEALDRPQQFFGTSVVVRTKNPVKEIIFNSIQAGFEPHFGVIFGSYARELQLLGEMLGVEICKNGSSSAGAELIE